MNHEESSEITGAGTVELAPGVLVDSGLLGWAFSRSGGPGGQNVNKVATRAELRVSLNSLPLPPDVLHRLASLAGRRVTDAGELQIISQAERSQQANKAECLQRLRELIVQARVRPKVRRPTKPSAGSKRRRLEAKKSRSAIKRGRRAGGGE